MSPLSRARFGVPLVVIGALIAFVAGSGWMSERLGTWSEEVSVYPNAAPKEARLGSDDTMDLVWCDLDGALNIRDTRPRLSLCLDGNAWPVMVDAYFAGWLYWPFAAVTPKNIFAQRKLGLLFGVGTLLLGFVLMARWQGPWQAAAGVVVASVSSSFVLPHALLVHFETVLLPLVTVAAWLVFQMPAGARLSRGRGALVGGLTGLAVAANVKAVFLLAGLFLFSWPERRRFLRPTAGTALVTSCAFLIPLVPMVLFALTDAKGGFEAQVGYRLENIFARISTLELFGEPLNLLRFWTDIGSYGDEAAGLPAHWPIWPQVVPAIALLWSGWHLFQRIRRHAHSPAIALLGALIWTYMLAGAVLYDQQPAANYAPLHVAFGLLAGAGAVRVGQWLSGHGDAHGRLRVIVSVAVVAVTTLGMAYNTYRRGDPATLPIATNALAQRQAVALLRDTPGTIATVGHNLAGVLEAVSGGEVKTTDITPYLLTACGEQETYDEACAAVRWKSLITSFGDLSVVIPERLALSDERRLVTAFSALESFQDAGAVRSRRLQGVSGRSTPPLLGIWMVKAAPN